MSSSGFANKRFGKSVSEKRAMFRNQVTSLIDNERLVTTLEKAKNLKRIADKMITLGKDGSLAARRKALSYVFRKDSVNKLFTELSVRFKDRDGGYTRVTRCGIRHGDAASLAIVEFLDNNVVSNKLEVLKNKKAKNESEKSEN